MKKIIAALLCSAMLLSVTGCGGAKKSDDSTLSDVSTTSTNDAEGSGEISDLTGELNSDYNNNSDSVNSNGVAPTTGVSKNRTVVNNCYTTGYPIAKDRVTLTIMIRDHANGLAKYNDSPLVKYIQDKMNITLSFEAVPPTDAVSDKMNLAFMSNKMPDMFWGVATMNSAYIMQGKVTELSQYINEYAPNVKKMFDDVPASKYLTTFDDGKTYMFPYVSVPEVPNYSYKLLINKTWLNNVGAKIPTTTDELRQVLIKFRDMDANKNGNSSDEIPLMFQGDVPPSMFGPFGASTYLNWLSINQSTNQIEYVPMTDAYRNGMKYITDLYKEKLLDQNFRGTSALDIKARSSATTPTVGVFATSAGYSEVTTAESYLSDYTFLPPLQGPAGSASTWSYVETENNWPEWFIVSKNCKYPEIAVRLADYFYSTEGTLVALQGPPGVDNAWNYDQNGKYVPNYSKVPSGKSFGEFCYSMTPGYPIPHYTSLAYQSLIKYTSSNPTANEKATIMANTVIETMFKNIKPTYVLPKLSFTSAENLSLNEIQNNNPNYKQYAMDMRFKFVSGGANLDTNWDSYVSNLKKAGVDDLLAIEQQAYNRYRVWIKNNK